VLLRGAEWGIAAAAGTRRTGSGAGLPPREGPGCGSFSFAGPAPCPGSLRSSAAASLRACCGASIRRCSVRSGIGPGSATPRHKGRPRTRCWARPASTTRALIFSRPLRSTRRWLGGRLPRWPAGGAWPGGCFPSCSGSGLGRPWLRAPFRSWCGRRCGPGCGFGPAEDGSGCGAGSGWRCSRQIRPSRCLDLSRPGPLHRLGRRYRLLSSRRGSRRGELGQAVFQEVVGLRVHGEGMDLARGG
jgi:hypothetical protein